MRSESTGSCEETPFPLTGMRSGHTSVHKGKDVERTGRFLDMRQYLESNKEGNDAEAEASGSI